METDRSLKLGLADERYSFGRQVLIYSLLFIVAAIGTYTYYIIGDTVFLTANQDGNKDGLVQIFPSYVAVKHIIEGVLAGKGFSEWNWSIGLGSDNWNMFASKLANPFTYLIALFPEEKLDIGYTVVSVFRQYCVGFTFMLFGRKVKLTGIQNILGGLCYAFSMWMFMTIPDQAGFNTAALLFPLLMLGAEKIIDGESPLLFIITVFYFLTAGVVWGYASGIMIVIYFFVMMLLNGKLKNPKEFFGTTGRFILCGIAGILIAAFFVSEILMSMSSATTDTGSGKQMWFTMADYLGAPKSLYKAVGTGANSYSAIGLPIVGVALMPMFVIKAFRGRCEAILATLLLIGTQIPAVCRAFNGFAYPSGRWFYMVAFFMTWAAIENFNQETFGSRIKCFIMELWLVATAGWVIYRFMYLGLDNRKTMLTAVAGLILGTLIIIFGRIWAIAVKKGASRTVQSLIIVIILLITAADIVEIGVADSFSHNADGVKSHAKIGDCYEAITGTSEAVMKTIQREDESFYRYSRYGGYFGVRTVGAVVNTSIAIGSRPTYICFSTAPSSWHEYNKVVGNSTGNYRRTLVDGNDSRAMLDYLMGVKYYLGSPVVDDLTSNIKSSLYVPYGYGPKQEVDGYEVFTNKYCMGLGTSYSQYITESELREFPVHLREQVLMQTAVVPDSYADKLGGVKHAKLSDIKTDVEEVDFEIEPKEGIEVDLDNKVLTIRDHDSSLKFKAEQVQGRQVMLALENFRRKDMSYEELAQLTDGYYTDKTLPTKPGFKIKLGYKTEFRGEEQKVWKGTKNEQGGVRSFNDIDTFNINMGYFENAPEKFEVQIKTPGIYTFDAIKLYAIPMDGYDKNAATLDSRKYDISEWSDDYVKGTMSCEEDSIMYFSILKNKGWHIYVDGEEVDKINDVNISFTGAMLPAGQHEVELKYVYPYKYELVAATLAGLLLTVGIMIRYNRRKKLGQSGKH